MARKNSLKAVCLITAVVTAATVAMSACSLRDSIDNNREVDKSRTQLYVGLGTNGIDEWMKYEASEFEKEYADVSFEEGKKGVQVFYNYDEKFANFDTLPLNYTGYQEKLIITESIPYENVKKMALDITNAVTSPLNYNAVTGETEGDETESVADKMLPQYRNYYGADGKFYAVPAQESALGIVYDVDLFQDYGLYFANGTTANYYEYECRNAYTGKTGAYRFVDGDWSEADFSAGPDGVTGTYDDGMPATYEEFFALCDYMYHEFSIEPIRWAGKVQSYATSLLTGLAADYEGGEYLLKTSCDGLATNLVRFDDSGNMIFKEDGTPETYSLQIEAENGYKMTEQAGYYYALKFMEALIGSDYYNKDLCFNGTKGHLTTQSDYLLSKKNSSQSPIAMLIDGCWWQGEASGTFRDMAEKYGEKWSVENRNFGFMSLPKADASKLGKQSTNMELEMIALVTKDVNETQEKVCKLFLKHMFRRSSLIDFTRITGEMRPYSLTLTEEEYDSLTGFGKSNYNLHTYTDLRFMPSYSQVYLTNRSLFTATANFHWQSNLGSVPTELLRSKYSAKDIFTAVHNYWTQERWDGYFKGICY